MQTVRYHFEQHYQSNSIFLTLHKIFFISLLLRCYLCVRVYLNNFLHWTAIKRGWIQWQVHKQTTSRCIWWAIPLKCKQTTAQTQQFSPMKFIGYYSFVEIWSLDFFTEFYWINEYFLSLYKYGPHNWISASRTVSLKKTNVEIYQFHNQSNA